MKCDRLLTSGLRPSAVEGIEVLSDIVKRSRGRIAVIAAAGINRDNAYDIISKSAVNGVHAGSSVREAHASLISGNNCTAFQFGIHCCVSAEKTSCLVDEAMKIFSQ